MGMATSWSKHDPIHHNKKCGQGYQCQSKRKQLHDERFLQDLYRATDGSGTFTETYTIPGAYHGSEKLAIRWESPSSGFYAYDWFVNDPAAAPSPSSPPAGSGTIPTFTITAVSRNNSVTIKGKNFTTNDTYSVMMGNYGTAGVGGIAAGSQATGASGSFTGTYNIPAGLHGKDRIAIRLESDTTPYYSYNWFWNEDHP
jgi:hypothetical protein